MATLKWSDDLRTGVEEIDAQHKELVRRIDSLDLALYGNKAAGELVRMMEYLQDYVEEHFRDEEDLMMRIDYPGLADHIEEHRKFEMKFKKLRQELQHKGANAALAREVDREVVQWFEHHLLEMDAGYVNFMKKNQ